MDSTTTNAHHRNRSNSSPHSNEGDAQRHSSYTYIHCLPRIDTPTAISPRKSHSNSEPNTPPEQHTPKQTDNHNIYSSIECGKNSGSRVFFTPARIPTPKKSASSPLLHSPPFSQYTPLDYPSMQKPQPHIAIPSSGDDDDEDGTVIFTSRRAESSSASGSGVARVANASLRTRLFGARDVKGPKSISTTPGQLGAGETETEADEPVSKSIYFTTTPDRHSRSRSTFRHPVSTPHLLRSSHRTPSNKNSPHCSSKQADC